MRRSRACAALSVVGLLLPLLPGRAHPTRGGPPPPASSLAKTTLQLPFVENQGQLAADVAFYARTVSGTLAVTHGGDLRLGIFARGPAGAPAPLVHRFQRAYFPVVRGLRRATPVVHLFRGSDPARWRTHLATYQQVALGELYDGIEVTLETRGSNVEQIFRLRPGADPARIAIAVEGARAIHTTAVGELALDTPAGTVRYTRPVAYQCVDGRARPVEVAYRVTDHSYGFAVGDYDASRPLVIDPMLATYLGGSGSDFSWALDAHYIAADSELYVYVVGTTTSTAATLAADPKAFQTQPAGAKDVFVARFDHDLTMRSLTFLGGTGDDEAFDVVVHPTTDGVYVTGLTNSSDFPTAPVTARGRAAGRDAFVARLRADLSQLEQSTYLGGSGNDWAMAIAIDQRMQGDPTPESVYIAGSTRSSDLPQLSGAAQSTIGSGSLDDAFVARLSLDLAPLRVSYLGGPSTDSAGAVAINPVTHDVYVGGQTSYDPQQGTSVGAFPWTAGGARGFGGGSDAFVVRLANDLSQAQQATYVGGTSLEFGTALAIHPLSQDVYLAGGSGADWANFPSGGAYTTIAGGQDAFVARLNPELTQMLGATLLGGQSFDRAGDILIAQLASAEVYVAGRTSSTDFPDTTGGAQPANAGGGDDLFIARLTSDLSTVSQATYLGGSSVDALHAHGMARGNDPNSGVVYFFFTGETSSSDFPAVLASSAQPALGGGGDSFVVRLDANLTEGSVADGDQDGVGDSVDNCPQIPNTDQLDTDRDGAGDACDDDDDDDTVADGVDNCPLAANQGQGDTDGDQVGNACDNCPQVQNPNQDDTDDDGVGDACEGGLAGPRLSSDQSPIDVVLGDRVSWTAASSEADRVASITLFIDGEPVRTCHAPSCSHTTRPVATAPDWGALAVDAGGLYTVIGNVPDAAIEKTQQRATLDEDGDGTLDLADNCPAVANPDQSDIDGDGVGDACDACCPECHGGLDAVYCCMPTVGYGSSCTDELGAGPGGYYWQQAYDRMLSNGCGCVDSDGDNIYTPGRVSVESEEPQHCQVNPLAPPDSTEMDCQPARSTCVDTRDSCVNGTTVREYACGEDGVVHQDRMCPVTEPVCVNGRCDCPDTDGGERYYQQGTLLGLTDECFIPDWGGYDDVRLREFFCGRDSGGNLVANSRVVECPYGCFQGRCECEDSDGGHHPERFGQIGLEADSCVDARTVHELYPELIQDEFGGRCEVRSYDHTCDGLCDGGECQPPSCEDRVQNQGEEAIDCGGPCITCNLCSLAEDALPTRFHWGDWHGRSWITPIRNQEACGSCWAFAAVAVMEAKYLFDSTEGWIPEDFFDPPDPTVWNLPDLSEQKLVSNCGTTWGDCTGGSKEDALNELVSSGTVDEACFPYNSGGCLNADGHCVDSCGTASTCSSPRDCPTTCADTGLAEWDARTWSLDSHTHISGSNTVNAVKKALVCHGPLATCSSDWAHCLTIVGWDNDSATCRAAYSDDGDGGCWILKNSHGVNAGGQFDRHKTDEQYWEEEGYVWIPFDGHDYSTAMRAGARYVDGVDPPAGWSWP